jgi:very-short-patch-repair endonuclease
MSESHLEAAMRLWLRAEEFPEWVEEHRWHPTRQWRFDFAWPKERVALEVEGGVWTGGRHNRAAGFIEDCEKYNEATADGWRVVRVTKEQIDSGRAVAWLQRLLACEVPPW